jgi:hypothetical protein
MAEPCLTTLLQQRANQQPGGRPRQALGNSCRIDVVVDERIGGGPPRYLLVLPDFAMRMR